MRFKSGLALAAAVILLAGCGPKNTSKIKIGLSLDTLKEERWQHDRDLFTAAANELGAQVLVQVANNSAALQNSQVEDLLTEGVNVLVVVPHDAKSAATIVEAAHKAGVPVLSYDRLIRDSDVDLYVSFDNFKVGQLQAQALLKQKPQGNYLLVEGAPTDNNAHLFHDGQMSILGPQVKAGNIKIVADQWADDWTAVNGLKITENALTQNKNQIDAVVAANDTLAGAALQALGEQGLAGKAAVSGQDADLAGCQRVAAGTQTMTVYKPIPKLAETAAKLAVDLAKKEPIAEKTTTVNNGKADIPSVLLDPIAVDKSNLDSTVIADGYQKKESVYSK
jgi:D-xylose transport system substrate-binding protein